MKNITKVGKAMAAIALGAGLLVGGAGMAMYNQANPVTQTKILTQEVIKEVPVEVIKTVNNTVEVPVEVIKEVEVLVDNGNLDLVLNEVYDNNGRVQYLLDDLDDDEVYKIADRIVFVNDMKSLALQHVEKELADEIDKEVVNGIELDEDDVEKLRLRDDADEIEVSDVDFDDSDIELIVEGKFRHDDTWYEFSSTVEIEDGEVEDFTVDSINEL